MRKFYTIIFLPFVIVLFCFTQTSPPKREFRGVWISTVTNIDWPSSPSLSVDNQKKELVNLLNILSSVGVNVAVFQIRPECDALYNSPYEPWSKWLTGGQGIAPNPLWDPLHFAVDEAHKRGMELHAWFNPYRAERSVGNYTTANNHVTKVHPEWILQNGNIKFLDPGLSEVRDYVSKIISDVVRRYEIDAAHMDDYFYVETMGSQDSATFANYPRGFTDIGEWRRDNVNTLIKQVHDSIKTIKPWVKWGISPRGIWKNGVPTGIIGNNNYSTIFCDAVAWMTGRYIDYLAPQLYWKIGGNQDFNKLSAWWYSVSNGVLMVPGLAAYKIGDVSFGGATEIANQIRYTRTNHVSEGNIIFTMNNIRDNRGGITDTLKNTINTYPALLPRMPWLDSIAPLAPSNLTASFNGTGVVLQWQKPGIASDNDSAQYYVIYRTQSPDTINSDNARQIIAITVNDSTRFTDNTVVNGITYSYLVTAFDKLNNESDVVTKINLTATGVGGRVTSPLAYSLDQNYPNPFNPLTTIQYTIQKPSFTSLKIYDLLGREIAVLVEGEMAEGTHQHQFSGANLASGVYVYRIVSGNFVQSKKMILQK